MKKIFYSYSFSLFREADLADGGQVTSPVNLTSSRFPGERTGGTLLPPADRAVVGITCRGNLPFPL